MTSITTAETSITTAKGRRARGTGGSYVDKETGLVIATLALPRGPNGKPRVKKFRAKTETAAFKLRAAYVAEQAASGLPAGDGTTVQRWGEYWVADVLEREKLNARTRQQYGRKLELYVYPHLGHLPLAQLQPAHLRDLLKKMGQQTGRLGTPLSVSTIAITRTIFLKAMKSAAAEGLRVDFVRLMTVPGPGRIPPRIDDALVPEEVAKILGAAQGNEIEVLVALRWGDLQLDQQPATLTVRAGKTESAKRTIPIDADMAAMLDSHLVSQGSPRPTDRVFLRGGVVPYVNNTLSARWVKLSEEALGHTVRFHALRHTAATLMWENGASVEEISKYLGHAGTQITADLYLKARPEKLQTVSDAMGKLRATLT
jgi:integrase